MREEGDEQEREVFRVRMCLNAKYDESKTSGTVTCEKQNMLTFLVSNGLFFVGHKKTAHILPMQQGPFWSRIQVASSDEKYIQARIEMKTD